MKCEICKINEETGIINIGLDVGFHIGDYGKGDYEYIKIEPTAIAVASIHLCKDCQFNIEKIKNYKTPHLFGWVITKLKEELKDNLVKQIILEKLK